MHKTVNLKKTTRPYWPYHVLWCCSVKDHCLTLIYEGQIYAVLFTDLVCVFTDLVCITYLLIWYAKVHRKSEDASIICIITFIIMLCELEACYKPSGRAGSWANNLTLLKTELSNAEIVLAAHRDLLPKGSMKHNAVRKSLTAAITACIITTISLTIANRLAAMMKEIHPYFTSFLRKSIGDATLPFHFWFFTSMYFL